MKRCISNLDVANYHEIVILSHKDIIIIWTVLLLYPFVNRVIWQHNHQLSWQIIVLSEKQTNLVSIVLYSISGSNWIQEPIIMKCIIIYQQLKQNLSISHEDMSDELFVGLFGLKVWLMDGLDNRGLICFTIL